LPPSIQFTLRGPLRPASAPPAASASCRLAKRCFCCAPASDGATTSPSASSTGAVRVFIERVIRVSGKMGITGVRKTGVPMDEGPKLG